MDPQTAGASQSSSGSGCILRLLLVNGKKHDFTIDVKDSIHQIKDLVFKNWPEDWNEEKVISVTQLRILFKGRFLDDDSSLELEKIAAGTTTVMHLVVKPLDHMDTATGEAKSDKPKSSGATTPSSSSSGCCILL